MNASYHVVELIRKKISNNYLTASDTDVANALGLSRAMVSAYKHGVVMSAETLEKAQEILQLPHGELWDVSTALMLEATPETKAVNAAHQWMREQAKRWGGAAVKGLALAMVAAGTIFAPAGNQASAASFDGPKYTLCALRTQATPLVSRLELSWVWEHPCSKQLQERRRRCHLRS